MRRERSRFTAAGLGVVLVGLGSPAKALAFREEFDLPFTILADADKRAYQAYGLVYRMNLLREANVGGVSRFLRDSAQHGATFTSEDMLQLGGSFVVDTTGTLRFVFRSLRAAEYPTVATLIASIA